MALGDVLNVGQDMLLCISGEGSLQVFDITSEPDAWTASETVVLSGPTVRHPVPVNICRACVADIDGDGRKELIVARTDRVLHAYRFSTRPAEATGTGAHRPAPPGLTWEAAANKPSRPHQLTPRCAPRQTAMGVRPSALYLPTSRRGSYRVR